MSGLIVLSFLLIWILTVLWLTFIIQKKICLSGSKVIFLPIFYVVIFFIPVSDEIMARFQFKKLCQPENTLIYDDNKLKDRQVKTGFSRINRMFKIVPIREQIQEWNEYSTNELLLTHKMYSTNGGVLIRTLYAPYGPIIFNGRCGYGSSSILFRKLDVTVIE